MERKIAMNVAVPFFRQFKYLDDPYLELNINYKPKIKQLDNFISKYGQKHRINFLFQDFNKEKDIEIINILINKYPNLKLIMQLPHYEKELEQILVRNKIPHYYNEYIQTWDRLYGFLSLDITDIIITGELAFNIETVSAIAKKKNINIRLFCNICQSNWEDFPSIKSFFIRPEDLILYAEYVNTIEFVTKNDIHILNVLYEVYIKEQKWFGLLKEIIIDYKTEEDNRFIIPRFGQKRLNCNQQCLKSKDIICHTCEQISDLSFYLKDKGLIVTLEK